MKRKYSIRKKSKKSKKSAKKRKVRKSVRKSRKTKRSMKKRKKSSRKKKIKKQTKRKNKRKTKRKMKGGNECSIDSINFRCAKKGKECKDDIKIRQNIDVAILRNQDLEKLKKTLTFKDKVYNEKQCDKITKKCIEHKKKSCSNLTKFKKSFPKICIFSVLVTPPFPIHRRLTIIRFS